MVRFVIDKCGAAVLDCTSLLSHNGFPSDSSPKSLIQRNIEHEQWDSK
jgi:hypothetical protein